MSTTVFISSTSRDLREHRAVVAQALLNAVPRLGSMTGKDAPEKFMGVEMRGTFAEMAEMAASQN